MGTRARFTEMVLDAENRNARRSAYLAFRPLPCFNREPSERSVIGYFFKKMQTTLVSRPTFVGGRFARDALATPRCGTPGARAHRSTRAIVSDSVVAAAAPLDDASSDDWVEARFFI